MENHSKQRKPSLATLKRFGMIFSLIATVLMLIVVIQFYFETQSIATVLENDDYNQVTQLSEFVSDNFDAVVFNLMAIAINPTLLTYLDTATELDQTREYFLSLVKTMPLYDQIRFLDETGMEVIRVDRNNGNPVLVPEDGLQMKGGRYYFTDSIGLDQGMIFVSPFDLNVEHGEIEQPLKPMLRFATPVFDSDGQRRGIVIINYLGAEIQQHLVSLTPWSQVMLLNGDGYWLQTPDPEDEWGFMYDDDRQENTFGNRYATAWERISNQETGQFHTDNGLFTFTAIYPLEEAWRSTTDLRQTYTSTGQTGQNEYVWKLVLFIPQSAWREKILANKNQYLSTSIGLLVVAFITSLFLTHNMGKRAFAESTLRSSEARYRLLFDMAGDFVFLYGPATKEHAERFVKASEFTCRALGYTHEEMMQLLPSNIILDTDDEAVFLNDSTDTQDLLTNQYLLHRHGDKMPVEIRSKSFAIDGDPVILSIGRDITERKQSEEALRRSEQRYALAQRAANMGSWDWDIQTNDLYWSEHIEALFGFEEGKFGTTYEAFLDCIHPEDRKNVAESVNDAIETGAEYAIEHRIIWPNGTIRWISEEGNVFRDENGKAIRMLGVVQDITERKKAEGQLRKLSQAVEQSPASIVITDLKGNIEYVNSTFTARTGYTQEEAIGQNPRILKSGQMSSEEYKQMWETITAGKIWQGEFLNKKKNGDLYWENALISPVKTDAGEITHFLAVKEDITERKQAEEQLRKLSQAVEQSPSAIFITDASGNIEYVNPRFTAVSGYTEEEIIGNNPRILQSGQTPPEVYQHMWKAITSGNVWQGDLLNKRKTGALYWDNTLIAPVKSQSNKITHFVTIKEDVSKRRQAEDALRESEEKLRSTLESVDDLVFVLDKEGFYIDYHQPIATVHGKILYVPPDAFIGRHYRDVIPPDVAILMKDAIDTIIDTQISQQVEYSLTTENKRMWFSAKLSMRRGSQGEFDGITCVMRNITARKHAEEGLLWAKQAADNANKAKSIFLANMNHELRTPLNAILGFAQIMAGETTLSQQHRKNVETILRSGEYLLSLINDILDISKVEAGKTTLNEVDFDLRQLLYDVFDLLKLKATEKGLRFELEGVSRIPSHAHGDSGKLRQVILNLLSNAIKFTEKGSVKVRVRYKTDTIRSQDQDPLSLTGRFFVEVEDTGMGIDSDEIDTIFDAFAQSQSGRQLQQGTGLGLAISKEFVHLMGGEIGVESTLGEGTRFMFDVQIKECGQTAQINGVQSSERPGGNHIAPGQPIYRALIVEDQWENQQMLVAIMEAWGFKVKAVNNGQEAVEIASSWRPHLIWMDIFMPVVDGLTATKRIRETGHDVVIIAVSAGTFTHSREEILEAGCDDFIAKPFRTQDLIEILKTHLQVAFINDGVTGETVITSPAQPLPASALADLPPELVKNLKSAALNLNIRTVQTLAEDVRHYNPTLVQVLLDWAKAFRFDKLLALIDEWEQIK